MRWIRARRLSPGKLTPDLYYHYHRHRHYHMHACVRARSDERLRALHVRRLSLLSEDFCKTKTFVEKGACVWMGGVGMCVCVCGGVRVCG